MYKGNPNLGLLPRDISESPLFNIYIMMKMHRVVLALICIFSMILNPSWAMKLTDGNKLRIGFYHKECPKVERIVADVVFKAYLKDQRIAPHFLRLFFHDCFVKGCDASILLDSTPSGEPVEMKSPANDGVKGLDVIDKIKDRLEKKCPGTVSCADILAFATRDAIALSGLPYHIVPAGRRDSHTSRAVDVTGNLPSGSTPIEDIIKIFKRKGFSVEDMVVLLGAHSFGSARCKMFDYRLNNFSSIETLDPSLNSLYAAHLSAMCQESGEKSVDFEPTTPLKLDNMFYLNLLTGRTLLQSDQAMASDLQTSGIVRQMAFDPFQWRRKFLKAMFQLGTVDVLTGNQGEIRKTCRARN